MGCTNNVGEDLPPAGYQRRDYVDGVDLRRSKSADSSNEGSVFVGNFSWVLVKFTPHVSWGRKDWLGLLRVNSMIMRKQELTP
jgi:hypothetical protein